ncbi:MAG: rhodanese-like domain-containing protein [Candidatus Paceibacterota bacterium]
MAQEITTEELKEKLDTGNVVLIDVLAAESYEARHIPGARSIPYGKDFIEQFEEQIGVAKDAEIITYCASSGCQLSDLAADALEEAGYSNVGHYVEGLAGWKNAGYEFEESDVGEE